MNKINVDFLLITYWIIILILDLFCNVFQVKTDTDTFMGYGAVCPDGYGCSYNPKPDCLTFCISAFNTSTVTNISKYTQYLDESLNSMHSLINRINKVK